VPDSQLEENDTVDGWLTANTKLYRFEVKVPPDTPQNERISIQFDPGFGWLEALPMWQAQNLQGEAVWRFDLTGPFNEFNSIRYRYCRQGQCGSADDAETQGFNLGTNNGSVMDEVTKWAWLGDPEQPASVPDVQITTRGADFIAGVAFQARYHPSWGTLLPNAIAEIKALGVNWLILRPTWSFTNDTPPILEQQPAQDMLWPELNISLTNAHQANLNIGLFPTAQFPGETNQWWQEAKRDYAWWVSFYERYSNFILHHAILAADTNASALIMGGDWLNPALPGGLLADGSSSNNLQDAEARWRDLIANVRQHYNGSIAWALTYPEGINNPPPFLDAFDVVYIQWSAALTDQPNASFEEMQAQAGAILDQEVLPLQHKINKPVVLAIAYPSIDRGNMGCIAILGGGCLDYDSLIPPNTDIPELTLNLQNQAKAYNAILAAINERSWIAGYVSMGYYPPAILQDKSISIHGKPASGVLWYWSQKYLGR
jgi:hypothetical protein